MLYVEQVDGSHNLFVTCQRCRRILYSAVSSNLTLYVARNVAQGHQTAYTSPHDTDVVIDNYAEPPNRNTSNRMPDGKIKYSFLIKD